MRECPACKLCFPDEVKNCPIDGDATFHSISGDPVLEGKYQLEKRLGQGGMGVVYKSRHNFLKTSHAIKVILPDLVGNDPNLVTRFRQEAIAAAAIRHQNIVSTTDFGVVNGKMPFLVMEFVQGESLHDLLVREKRLSPTQALSILSGICSGLSAAHRQEIVHRDLKPLNVMIQNGVPIEEGVKILDFGLAKIKSGELLGSFIQAQTTGLMGSPYYMAPEQWSDDEPDARADVYSLGIMLYQMMAGDVPFKGTSIPSIMRKHLSDPMPRFAEFGVEVSPEVEAVVAHALEKDAERRTQSAEQLVAELRRAIGLTTVEMSFSDPQLGVHTQGGIHQTETGRQQRRATDAFTTLRILTNPPRSTVILDDRPLGISEDSGWLIAPNIPRGTHRLKVLSDGYAESESNINCESEVFQTVVQLRSLLATNVAPELPKPQGFVSSKNNVTTAQTGADTNLALNADNTAPIEAQNVGIRSYPEPTFEKTNIGTKQNTQRTGVVSTPTMPPPVIVEPQKKSSVLIPVLLGVFVVGLIAVAGGGYAVYRYLNPGEVVTNPTPQNSPAPNASPTAPPVQTVKAEMVKIEGGTFMMGAKSGQLQAMPAHSVTVKSFMMDKTEVTNAAYAEFVAATGHRAPEYWAGPKPPSADINLPVVFVSLDDAKAFAKWRSERDKVQYRLPTEQEWEYAARNGADATTYPWGNNWIGKRGAVEINALAAVGSMPDGGNKWGAVDLIGNVWEWTDSKIAPYPGATDWAVKKDAPVEYVVRGGSIKSNREGDKSITSTWRTWIDPKKGNNLTGFRLVSDAN
jgi:eukaryotic-like serine/threonine-protein kinase